MTKDGKAYCLTARYQGAVWWNSIQRKQRTMVLKDKPTVSKNGLNHIGDEVEIVKVRKHEVEIKYLQDCLRQHKKLSERTNKEIAEHLNVPITLVEHWFRTDNSFSIPSEDIWFKLKNYLSIRTTRFDKQITEFEYREGVFESSKRVYHANGKAPTLTATMSGNQKIYTSVDKPISKYGLKQVGIAHLNGHDLLKRVYSSEGKSPTLNAHGGGNTEPKVGEKNLWRKLTPLECERLQTVPDNYTQGVSNTQRYKMIGNGWTVDVIAHILKNITKE